MTVSEQEANRPKCLDGTRVDLLQKIRIWASATDSPNIFLLTGIAGTGKSTVARTIAEQFEKEGRLGCYIFFERGKTDSSTITSTVIRTIAYHLARNNPIVAQFIWEATPSWLNGQASHLQIFYSKNCYTTHFLRQFNRVPRRQVSRHRIG